MPTMSVHLMCFYCTFEQAQFFAQCGNMPMYVYDYYTMVKDVGYMDLSDAITLLKEHNPRAESGNYYMWQDRQTGGGGCRITWYRGIAWISSHSGYPHADFTREMSELFSEICKPCELSSIKYSNPLSYGTERVDEVL
jgi:hypothetical protein